MNWKSNVFNAVCLTFKFIGNTIKSNLQIKISTTKKKKKEDLEPKNQNTLSCNVFKYIEYGVK